MKVVLGPGTFINEAAGEIDEQLATQRPSRAEARPRRPPAWSKRRPCARGLGAARARALGRQAHKIWIGRFQESLVALALQYGLTSRPSIEDPQFVSALVFARDKPAGTPRAALRLPVPGAQHGARVGAHEVRALAGAARPHDRARASGRRDAAVAAGKRRELLR